MRIVSLILLLLVYIPTIGKEPVPVSMVGKAMPDFSLRSFDGGLFNTADCSKQQGLVVIFTCNHCPFARLYSERFNALWKACDSEGIPVVAVNPMDSVIYETETLAGMKQKAEEEHFLFPYLRDADQSIARAFHATHTPMAFVLWKAAGKWIVRYQGAIDDNGEHPEQARSFIREAIDALKKGEPVKVSETKSFGCAIYYGVRK